MLTSLLRHNKNYRLLFSGAAASNLGDGVSILALPWLASLISRDPLHISMVASALTLPWLLLALPAGVITDRVSRQRLIARANMVRVGLCVCLVGLILHSSELPLTNDNTEQLVLIVALSSIAFLLGTAEVFADNSAQTLLPSLVRSDQLEQANGQLWSVEQLMGSFAGPPLAGVLFLVAIPAPFAMEALMFGLSVWFISQIKLPEGPFETHSGLWQEMTTGFRWIAAHRLILTLAVMLGLLNALNVMALTILVLFSQEILHLSSLGHGTLLTAGAAGGVVGGLLGPAITERLGNQRTVLLALLIFPLPYIVIGSTSSVVLVALSLFVEMFAALLWNLVTVSWRQRSIPNELLGRVNSIYRFFGWGLMPIGALAGGMIVTNAQYHFTREVALRVPYMVAAIGCVALLLFAIARLRFPQKHPQTKRRVSQQRRD